MNYFYLAKPVYGGWVSFTAHLMYQLKRDLVYKIGTRLENKARHFGYGIGYQNVPDQIFYRGDNFILALDKHHYHLIPKIPDGATIVVHDTVEIKSEIEELLKRCGRVICIRQQVSDYLKEKMDIDSEYLYHPFYPYDTPKPNKTKQNKTIAMSRVDWDKHTDIILKANQQMTKPIEIYGAVNQLYEFHKLKELNFKKYYKGTYEKDWNVVGNILSDAKFMIDLTMIHGDGNGTQYTFLEAIHQNVALILNRDWLKVDGDFTENVNCYAVSDEDELVDLLKINPDTAKITRNARKLLQRHIDVDWR